MKLNLLSDLQDDEGSFPKETHPVKRLLRISLELFNARHTGVLYGTNHTKAKFLPTSVWDRGYLDSVYGKGLTGWLMGVVGPATARWKKLSPVYLKSRTDDGQWLDAEGLIAFTLRNTGYYYQKGVRVIVCPDSRGFLSEKGEDYVQLPCFVYDGNRISPLEEEIHINLGIVRMFSSRNSIYIYLPDYGILVINTADDWLVETDENGFVHPEELTRRLDILIHLVESYSLAYLGQLKGKTGAQLLWHKEKRLRVTSEKLADSEKKYRGLYENAPVAYITMDADGHIQETNRMAHLMFKCTENELKMRLFSRFLTDEGASLHSGDGDLLDLARAGQPVKDVEVRVRALEGTLVWVSLSINPVIDGAGRLIEFRAMLMDISRRKELEKQLIQVPKMKAMEQFAGGLAHDFNNSLSPVSGYAQALMLDPSLPDPVRKKLEVVFESVSEARNLVSRILGFCRHEKQQFQPVSAARPVQDALTMIRSFLPPSIRLKTDIASDAHTVQADPEMIQQMVINLALNANDAMKEDSSGTLEIRLENMSEIPAALSARQVLVFRSCVRLSVSDTGTKCKVTEDSRVFEPYSAGWEKDGRSGVELAVVQGIVENHNGIMEVSSRAGQGTRFDIYLPVTRMNISIPKPATGDPFIRKGSERVLMVDDDEKVLTMQGLLLEKLGYLVISEAAGQKALDHFARDPNAVDLVITDQTMPGMSGIAMAKEIYALRPDLPVLICSGMGELMEKASDQPPNVKAVIKKPIVLEELSMALTQALDPTL